MEYASHRFLPNSNKDYKYLSALLSGSHYQHPFKYLLVLFWLESVQPIHKKREAIKIDQEKSKKDLSAFCKALLKQGCSLAETSRLTGKSRCYLKALAIKSQIAINLNPKKINEKVIQGVLLLARKGFHRRAIAQRFKVSLGSIEQIISSEEGLVEVRRRFKYESIRRRYKAQILRIIENKPWAIKQEIKELNYPAFYWLYRHERKWLNDVASKPSKPKQNSGKNWVKRDLKLAKKVKTILESRRELISLSKLDKLLGGHGWLIRMRHKLPLTMEAFYRYSHD